MIEETEKTTVENTEETKTETETTPNNEVGKPTEAEEEIVIKAKEVAEQKLEAEKLKAENLEREEKLLARKEALAALGGGSPAGDKPEVKEETPEDYKNKVMTGEIGR